MECKIVCTHSIIPLNDDGRLGEKNEWGHIAADVKWPRVVGCVVACVVVAGRAEQQGGKM